MAELPVSTCDPIAPDDAERDATTPDQAMVMTDSAAALDAPLHAVTDARDTLRAGAPTRVVFVGHVDHGKSTVIGRLLHDTGNLMDGSAAAAIASSLRRGTRVEWSFVLDSLQAERDQGVTIDATRLPFTLDGRGFVIVDAPGHRQFLRNMVTGAADADAAVLVVDAAEGVQEQTSRHATMLRMIGIRHVIVLLNKADKLDFDQARLAAVSAAVTAVLGALDIIPAAVIPIAARDGDNMNQASARMPWHAGPTLVQALGAIPLPPGPDTQGMRLPVQDVYRDGEHRVVVGRIERGTLRAGDTVAIGAQGTQARVARFVAWQAQAPRQASVGESVAIVLEPDVVVERGDLLYPPDDPPLRAARLRTRLFWLRAEPLHVGESFSLRLATAEHPVTVASIDSVQRIDDVAPAAGVTEVPPEGFAEITLHAPEGILFDPFMPGGAGGRGVLADAWQRIVGGAPLLGPAAVSATKQVFPTDSAVTLRDRAHANGHYGAVFWMTGLPGSGKSTIARLAEALLFNRGIQVVVLDGDTLRARLNSDLGFAEADRTENIRRTASVARLMADNGIVVLTSLISPTAAHRALARVTIGEVYAEVYIDADLATCEARDPKGLYAAARSGRLPGFTGIGAPYEAPEAADIVLDTTQQPPEASAAQLATLIEKRVRLAGRSETGRGPGPG